VQHERRSISHHVSNRKCFLNRLHLFVFASFIFRSPCSSPLQTIHLDFTPDPLSITIRRIFFPSVCTLFLLLLSPSFPFLHHHHIPLPHLPSLSSTITTSLSHPPSFHLAGAGGHRSARRRFHTRVATAHRCVRAPDGRALGGSRHQNDVVLRRRVSRALPGCVIVDGVEEMVTKIVTWGSAETSPTP
jgi:hypothetical protein